MRLSRRFLAIVGAADPPPHGFPSRCPCRLWRHHYIQKTVIKEKKREVQDELPLVVWYQTKPSQDITEGRRKSLDELQKEVNQFLEKWHRKPHKAVEKDWDRGDDLEL